MNQDFIRENIKMLMQMNGTEINVLQTDKDQSQYLVFVWHNTNNGRQYHHIFGERYDRKKHEWSFGYCDEEE